MNPSKTSILYLSISVLCLASVLWIVHDFFVARQKSETAVSVAAMSGYDVSELANSALEIEIVIPTAEFAPRTGSLFKAFGAGHYGRAVTVTAVKPRRLSISLKGLMENPPLAILEDARGETHIKAQGDFIHGAQIIAINVNSVIVKDSSGTYELTVEENR